jgi:hypothetical protein
MMWQLGPSKYDYHIPLTCSLPWFQITVEEAERKFLKEFANAATKEDPLDSMSQYVTWFEEHFPSGKQKYFYPILYKICTTYGPMNNYKNDERLLKIWMKLVENFPESGLAVMEFAFTKDSCRQLAKFYINWSEMYQSFGKLLKYLCD